MSAPSPPAVGRRAGLLGLVGGDEFHPGNEAQDALFAAAAGPGGCFVVPTAAARHEPQRAVQLARDWFGQWGMDLESLDVLTRRDAADPGIVAAARAGGLFYLVGGDPGVVVDVLRGSPVFAAIRDAWRAGAVLAGSSAGAMALARWTLVRASWPGAGTRRYADALGLLAGVAVLPHFDTFGAGWVDSARAGLPDRSTRLVGIDERTCALWDGTGWRAVGPGGVTVLSAAGGTRRVEGGAPIPDLPAPD